MRASAGTAASGRGAGASHRAAPRAVAKARTKSPAPKKAAPAKRAASARPKSAPPPKKPPPKPVAKQQRQAAPVAKKLQPPKPAPRPAAKPAVEPVKPPPPKPVVAAPPPPPPPPAAPPRPPVAAAPAPHRIMPDRPPPRPLAKPETFIEGDYVVYPTHGVGKVERIATEEIAGHKLELIHITFEENRMTLRVPVAKARSAGLRKLATRKLFDEALGVLKGRARIKRTMWSRRAQEYEAKINSGDPLAIAEVVRDLHRNAGQPDQSFSERQIYEAAMDRLAAELAALDKTDKLTAAGKLSNFLKTV